MRKKKSICVKIPNHKVHFFLNEVAIARLILISSRVNSDGNDDTGGAIRAAAGNNLSSLSAAATAALTALDDVDVVRDATFAAARTAAASLSPSSLSSLSTVPDSSAEARCFLLRVGAVLVARAVATLWLSSQLIYQLTDHNRKALD
jgi:hypothetical protein